MHSQDQRYQRVARVETWQYTASARGLLFSVAALLTVISGLGNPNPHNKRSCTARQAGSSRTEYIRRNQAKHWRRRYKIRWRASSAYRFWTIPISTSDQTIALRTYSTFSP